MHFCVGEHCLPVHKWIQTVYTKSPYRPRYHFSPERDGLVILGIHVLSGKYHMYWWGKVESTDLILLPTDNPLYQDWNG